MKGDLIRGRRTNYVRVDHAVLGATERQCLVCECVETVHTILEPGNLVMCTLCNTVSAK